MDTKLTTPHHSLLHLVAPHLMKTLFPQFRLAAASPGPLPEKLPQIIFSRLLLLLLLHRRIAPE